MADDETLGIISHVLGVFFGFLGPLVTYLIAEEGFGKENSKNALNWQISLLIYGVISGLLAFVLVGFFLMGLLGLLNLIFSVMAAVKASNGETWEYPVTISFL